MKIKYSVIIPLYNADMYICECINSIINCNRYDLEIIVIDDCSTDNSLVFANQFKNDERIEIIQNKRNQGQAFTRNLGIDKASGDYLCFLDADDYIDSNYFEILDLLILENPQVIHINFRNIYGEIISENKKQTMFRGKGMEFLKKALTENTYICMPWSYIFNRQFLIENHIKFPEEIRACEDEYFMLECLNIAEHVYSEDNIVYNYRYVPNSVMHDSDKTIYRTECKKYIFEKIKNSYTSEFNILARSYMAYTLIFDLMNYYSTSKEYQALCSYIKELDIVNELTDVIFLHKLLKYLFRINLRGSIMLIKKIINYK